MVGRMRIMTVMFPLTPDKARRSVVLPAALAVAMLWSAPGLAEVAQTAGAGAINPTPHAADASVSHAAAKGITLKIGSALKKILIFSVGTGSVAAGGALTAITTASGYAVYVANEYLWDSYAPNTNIAANNQPFDTSASLWRNTTKYLTLKPVGMAVTWSLIYAYTGSWAATLAMGSASSLAGPLVFYANNIGWDWYDWHSNAAAPSPAAPDKQPRLGNLASKSQPN
jgi:uncharacterized membrane protein